MRRRLTWLAVSTGVLLFVGWAWLAPSLGGGGGEVLVMASARGAESLPGGSLDLHSRAGGWSTLTTLGRASVPAAPETRNLTSIRVALGDYDSVRIGNQVLVANLKVSGSGLEPLLLAIADGRPVAAYAGNDQVTLGLGELSGRFQPLPDFDLIDQAGRPLKRADLAGRQAVVAAFHTTCRETCPLYTGLLFQLRRKLPAAVGLYEVSTDPANDSVAALQAYARVTGLDWKLLTGDSGRLQAFWTPLGVQLSGAQSHSDFVGVVDAHGYLLQTWTGVPDVGGSLPAPLQGLLDQEGRRELQHPQGWGPAQVLDAVRAAGLSQGSEVGGGQAAAFSAPTLDGRGFSLASAAGSPVLVNFWATYCEPCKREMPLIEAVARGNPTLKVVLVDERDDTARARAFVKQLRLSSTVVLDPDGQIGGVYGVASYPVTVFIRADGTIEGRYIGETNQQILSDHIAAIG